MNSAHKHWAHSVTDPSACVLTSKIRSDHPSDDRDQMRQMSCLKTLVEPLAGGARGEGADDEEDEGDEAHHRGDEHQAHADALHPGQRGARCPPRQLLHGRVQALEDDGDDDDDDLGDGHLVLHGAEEGDAEPAEDGGDEARKGDVPQPIAHLTPLLFHHHLYNAPRWNRFFRMIQLSPNPNDSCPQIC